VFNHTVTKKVVRIVFVRFSLRRFTLEGVSFIIKRGENPGSSG
jgi:hypothetical protein